VCHNVRGNVNIESGRDLSLLTARSSSLVTAVGHFISVGSSASRGTIIKARNILLKRFLFIFRLSKSQVNSYFYALYDVALALI
jgi:hypothetical protein